MAAQAQWGWFKRFAFVFAMLCGFNALYMATFWLRGDDMRFGGLMMVILSFMSFLYSAAYTLAVGAAPLKRPLFLLAYHVALGLALYVPAFLFRVLDERTLSAAAAYVPLTLSRAPYGAYWLFLLAAVVLSGYKQFRAIK